jgi:hypothetical protein
MKRRFNYTQRRKIPRSQVAIAWVEPQSDAEPLQFAGELNLELIPPLPSNAEVFLEVYSGPVSMRFPCGTVDKPVLPEDRKLNDFAPGQRPLLRVKVTSPDDPLKRLLARADSISPMSPDEAKTGRRSILPVELLDLGDLVWRVNMDDPEQPILQLNKSINQPNDISTMAKEGDFLGLAYPAVIREILTALLHPDSAADGTHHWIDFGSRMAGCLPPNDDDFDESANEEFAKECRIWIEKAVSGFASHFEVSRAFVTSKIQANHEA